MMPYLFVDAPGSKPNPGWNVPPSGKNLVLQGKRVIVVEDEGVTQMQLHRILTQQEMDVVDAATSGPEAVALVLRAQPDIVLMDISMPGEFDGLEAARRILAVQNVCIVMLTAYSDEAHREQARQIGTCGYVTKPIDQDTLIPQLEAAIKAFRPQ